MYSELIMQTNFRIVDAQRAIQSAQARITNTKRLYSMGYHNDRSFNVWIQGHESTLQTVEETLENLFQQKEFYIQEAKEKQDASPITEEERINHNQ